MNESDPQMDRLPEPLVQALRRMDARPPAVPGSVDRAVLGEARAHFAGRGAARTGPVRLRVGWPWWAGAVAAAVLVGVLVFVAVDMFRDRTGALLHDLGGAAGGPLALGPGSSLEAAWDADRSGRLDVLDLLILARRQEAGDPAVTPAILADLGERIVSLEKVAMGMKQAAIRLAGRGWVCPREQGRAG